MWGGVIGKGGYNFGCLNDGRIFILVLSSESFFRVKINKFDFVDRLYVEVNMYSGGVWVGVFSCMVFYL